MFSFFKKREKKEPEDIKEIFNYLKELDKNLEKISKNLDDLKEKSNFFIQKIGIVRFNPFSEVGGDQSFSIALLDNNNDGVVITSLYTREENRMYAKPIKGGISEYSLSEEEKTAIKKAQNKNNGKTKRKFNNPTTDRGGSRSY